MSGQPRPSAPRSRDIVIFDGECAICRAFRRWTKQRDRRGALELLPYQEADLQNLAPGLTRQMAEQTLWLIKRDGVRFHSTRAIFETLRRLPGAWGLIGAVMSWPPISLPLEPFYKLFARHRGRFARFVE